MDLRRLEVFVTLMENRSFSKTGQELGLTQPTISGHIKTLEQQIGLKLFDRHRRQVRPTAAALVLLDYAKNILELKNELCEGIRTGQADHDPWRREVMAHVRQTLIKKLKIANPRMIERAQEKF